MKRYEHRVDIEYILGGAGSFNESAYIEKIEKEGWELCGPPIADGGYNWIYYWKRKIE